jgi:hypothetical protein
LSRALVNFFSAHPVGHAVEALHYVNGRHVADPELEARRAGDIAYLHQSGGQESSGCSAGTPRMRPSRLASKSS